MLKGKAHTKVEVFVASLVDINKALVVKARTDPYTKLPKHFHEFLDVCSRIDANKLPPLQGKGRDYKIVLEKENGYTLKIP
jgi:hypothetical protein